MSKTQLTKVPFKGTEEQANRLSEVLKGLKGKQGALMPALQKAQEIYGYLPIEVQKIVAEELGLSLEQVFGVATFYAQFSLNPKGENKIGVCLGTACYVKGAGEIFEKFKELLGINGGDITPDGKFSLDATRCIGCCGLAPVITVNENVYGKLTAADVAGILAQYK